MLEFQHRLLGFFKCPIIWKGTCCF